MIMNECSSCRHMIDMGLNFDKNIWERRTGRRRRVKKERWWGTNHATNTHTTYNTKHDKDYKIWPSPDFLSLLSLLSSLLPLPLSLREKDMVENEGERQEKGPNEKTWQVSTKRMMNELQVDNISSFFIHSLTHWLKSVTQREKNTRTTQKNEKQTEKKEERRKSSKNHFYGDQRKRGDQHYAIMLHSGKKKEEEEDGMRETDFLLSMKESLRKRKNE